jgi:sensor histidine kinase YesM
MLLQPLVENSIKHGLAQRVEGGKIIIRTARHDSRLVIEIEDNGVGFSPLHLSGESERGIGISNVHERLRVLYGEDFRFDIRSQEGAGTHVRIEFPEVVSVMQA